MKMICLILILSLGCQLADATVAPGLIPVAQPDFNFGSQIVGNQVEHTFLLVNPSATKPLQIKSVKSSCPCTSIVSFTTTVKPGTTGSIAIKTNLDKIGHKEVAITATLDDGNFQTYQIMGEIVPQLVAAKTDLNAADFVDPHDPLLKSVTFIDLRQPIAFDQAHIPLSLNVPVFGLSNRAYLAKKPIVLVGSGIDDVALDTVLKGCRSAGFVSVHVLKGGIRLWQQTGGALTGINWQKPPLSTAPIPELVQSARHSAWTLFLPESMKRDGVPPLLCPIVTYSSDTDLQLKLTKAQGNIAVFASALPPTLKLPATQPLFLVTDPWAQYVQLADLEAVAQQKPQIVKVSSGSLEHRVKNCPTCP